jgi:Family of unknown function (DUF5762)
MSIPNKHIGNKDDTIIPFWYQDPNILLHKNYITEFFPLTSMTFNQKLNALSRTIIFATILIFAFTRTLGTLIASFITLLSVYALFINNLKEGFEDNINDGDDGELNNPAVDYLKQNNIDIPKHPFQSPSSRNPFGNTLLTDDVHRKPAPPIINLKVKNDILEQAKKLVKEANPGQPDITDKLFTNLNDKLGFEQSLRPFHTNPNSTIPNDQGAFTEFCYGTMNSCKSGNLFACAKQTSNQQNV